MTVFQKQCLLNFLGYDTGGVDGILGQKTRNAIECCKEDLGIPADGVWGQQTETAVLEAVCAYDEGMDDATDNNVGDKQVPTGKDTNVPIKTGTFWDEIEFFDHSEFKCTCGGRGCNGFPVEPVERLVRNLETTRKHFGKVVPVSSGVRCQLRNSELPGSAANSLHMRGKAADFAVTGIHSSVTLAYIKTLPNVDEAYAIDNSFVHMGVLEYE